MTRGAIPLMTVEMRIEHDVVQARQRGRQIAGLAGLDLLDQTRFSTAVSEIARNAVQYAGGGQARFLLTERPLALAVEIEDRGPGLNHLDQVLDGTYVSRTGMGIGLAGSRRLMDEFRCDTGPAGTLVRFAKHLPPGQDHLRLAAHIGEGLASLPSAPPIDEMRIQNREMLSALENLREREMELIQLNRELEATNRGVVALYAELDQRAEQLREVSDIKSRFLSNMTHEFRTPLNSIIALSRLLLDRVDGPLSSEQERQVEFIRKGATGLAEMVDDLLDLAKVESGKLEVTAVEFSLGDTLDSLRGMLKPLLRHNQSVQLVVEDAPDVRLFTDERKLVQIVRNFIANALKFTERGEVRVTSVLIDQETLSIAVVDTGIGISEDDQRQLFADYTQVKGPHQRRMKGTGLGLSLSARLAELLGGSVSVASRVGMGSTFTVRLPVRYGQPPQPQAESPRRTTVLHVDDDEAFRYLMRTALAGRFSLLEAADGATGLQLARSAHPDAVVIDLDMPGIDGFAFYAALRDDPGIRDIPVVVLSSYAPRANDGRLRGCAAVIDKNLTDDPGTAVTAALREAGLAVPA